MARPLTEDSRAKFSEGRSIGGFLPEAGLRTGAIILLTLLSCLVIWCLRRPDQFLHPYVWAEESQILNRYETHGFLNAALHPYVGYFLWPTSVSGSLAAAGGFRYVPSVEYWLSTLWFACTLCLILLPVSKVPLAGRTAFTFLLVLTPMDPEVFGVVLNALWWTSLWPLISLLWSKDYWLLRIVTLVLGGMSSFAGALLLIPYAFSYAIERRRRDLAGTLILAACLILQIVAYLESARAASAVHPTAVGIQALRTYSFYALTWVSKPPSFLLAISGAFVILILIAMVMNAVSTPQTTHHREMLLMLIASAVTTLVSAVPAPLIAHPVKAGPRYFFLPFVVLSWLLALVIMGSKASWARLSATILVLLSVASLSQAFSRHSEFVDWSGELSRCQTANGPFFVPVHTTGDRADMWPSSLIVTPATCHRLERR
jgi:hypothetical protein